MILTGVVGALCALAVLVLARPFLSAHVGRRPWSSRLRRMLVVAAAAASAVAVTAVMLDGTGPPAPAAAGPADPPRAAAPGAAAQEASTADLAAVDRAVRQVRRHPRQVAAHLTLARAYAGAQQPQLATVEYLAVTRLDPGNAEANTALAQAAFTSGSAESAKKLVDLALRTRPRYPEALYLRGLVNGMGLHRTPAAERDLRAYLRVAPFGAHRTTVQTVLTLLDNGVLR
jgi:cytochrome c-type biogenesis protein CcmH/NrfG